MGQKHFLKKKKKKKKKKVGVRLFGTKQYINENSIFIGDKAKGRISRQVTRKQSSPNFPKNERFLNVRFSENLASFVFLLAPS